MAETEGIFRGWSTQGRRDWRSTLEDDELVVRDLLNRLATRKGEHVMQPDEGSLVADLLFDPDRVGLREELAEDIRTQLRRDPRIEAGEVRVYGDPGELVAEAVFTIRHTDVTRRLVVRLTGEGTDVEVQSVT